MIVVTTALRPTKETVSRAQTLAQTWGLRYVSRHAMTTPFSALVVTAQDVRYVQGDQRPFIYHPGMAMVRAKRLASGESDALLQVAKFTPGDTVLDATAGLGADAAIFSFAGGERTTVTAIEHALPVAIVLHHGLQHYTSSFPAFDTALRRIAVEWGDHRERIAAMPPDSVDIVYFDPMFSQPIEASSGLDALRLVADRMALTAETITKATRVARKTVVIKARIDSPLFAACGCTVWPSRRIAYGVIAR